jgi:tRNA 2-thiouridine synthesizing protein A
MQGSGARKKYARRIFLERKRLIVRTDRELDVKGLRCPLPILRTKKALAEMASGQILRVVATDAHAAKDFRAFARQTGNELLSDSETNSVFEFFFKRK